MILAIIPARGGSEGIPRKNLQVVGDKAMISWTIEASLGSPSIDFTVVSRGDLGIAKVAEDAGAKVPFIRPTFGN